MHDRLPGALAALACLAAPTLAAGAAAAGVPAPPRAGPSAPHEDDPKLQDRRPAWVGRGYRSAAAARGGGSIEALAASVVFPREGVALHAWLPLAELGGAESGNDCWGYTSPSGRRYALVGTSSGTAFVEVTVPGDPQVVAVHPGPTSLWRDVKTYQHHAYAVSEGGSGIQVFDLGQIDAGVVALVNTVTSGPSTTASHNVAIDEVSGFLYRCGGGDNGLRIYSLANPASPTYVGQWTTRYVHDVQVVTYTSGPLAGRQIAYACSGFNGGFVETGVDALDVTSKTNIVALDRVTWPGAEYSHQAWLSEDRRYLYVNDELDEGSTTATTRTYVIDAQDPANLAYLGSFTNGSPAVGHNLYVHDGLVLEANYTSGLRVFDANVDPLSPPEVAWFDTEPLTGAASFNSLWSNYPYFGDGLVIGSDLEKGLFVWHVGPPEVAFEFPTGVPTVAEPGGTSFAVRLVEATPGALDTATPALRVDDGAGLATLPLAPLGGDLWQATLPAAPCGDTLAWYVVAQSDDGLVWTSSNVDQGVWEVTPVAEGLAVAQSFDMQLAAGWSSGAPGDSASTGTWERVVPLGTAAAPAADHSPGAGGRAWVTGQGSAGGALGDDDVDGGATTLLSPVLDLAGEGGATIGYWRWYSNAQGNPPDDALRVDVSNDGGQTWTNVETVGPEGAGTGGGWLQHRFRVADFVPPTAAVRLRFVAADAGSGSIVEAAIDDVTVELPDCPDCDGDGLPDGAAIAEGAVLDLDGDGVPDACQPLSADVGALSVSQGGAQHFALDAGPAQGGRPYLLLGSVSGTAPPLVLDGVALPLVPDAYTTFTLASPNAPPLSGSFGALAPAGTASAAFALPAGSSPAFAGATVHHAFLVLDLATPKVAFASNALPVVLTP